MKTLFSITILFLTLSCPFKGHCQDSNPIQQLRKGQPFPYELGVAMTASTYATIKDKIVAADHVVATAQNAIDGLKREIKADSVALRAAQDLGALDREKAAQLTLDLAEKEQARQAAVTQLAEANSVLRQARAALPTRLAKRALTPQQLADAVVDQLQKARSRPVKWGIVGVVLGLLLPVLL